MGRGAPTTSAILDAAGTTFSEQAGLTLRDTPESLFQLLVLSALLAKPIDSDLATRAARELRRAGVTSPRRSRATSWQARVDALGRAHYRRFDESMATRVDQIAAFLLDNARGDARHLGASRTIDKTRVHRLEVPGIGPTGADIFLREVQGVWSWAEPYLDERVLAGARRLGLCTDPSVLRRRFTRANAARLAAALVRAERDDHLVERLTADGRQHWCCHV